MVAAATAEAATSLVANRCAKLCDLGWEKRRDLRRKKRLLRLGRRMGKKEGLMGVDGMMMMLMGKGLVRCLCLLLLLLVLLLGCA